MTAPAAPDPQPESPAPAPPRRQRSRRRKWLLVGMALGVCLILLAAIVLVAEWILRSNAQHPLHYARDIRYLYQESPDGIVVTPNWHGTQSIEKRTLTVTTNNLGLRGAAPIGAKQPDERRVLVLGDSMVFGQGVDDPQTFPAHLQSVLGASLASEGLRVTVGNGGMIGAGVRDQLPMLRRAMRNFSPDVVVSCIFLGNDFTDDLVEDKAIVDGRPQLGANARLAKESWRFRLAVSSFVAYEIEHLLLEHLPSLAWKAPPGRPWLLPPPPAGLAAEQQLAYYTYNLFMDRVGAFADLPPHVAELLRRLRDTLAELRETASPVPLLIAIVPSDVHALPNRYAARLAQNGLNPEDHVAGTVQGRIQTLCGELGLDCIDLTPGLQAAPERFKSWLRVDRHFSPVGNRRVAGILAPAVQALLPNR